MTNEKQNRKYTEKDREFFEEAASIMPQDFYHELKPIKIKKDYKSKTN